MSATVNELKAEASMHLVEAATLVERLQGRAAHAGEIEALRIARNALLLLVAEGYSTLYERLRAAGSRAAGDLGRAAD